MKRRIAIPAIVTAAALGGTCAFLVPAASASTAVKSHTITFTSVEQATHNYSQTVSSQQDRDVNGSGKVIGYDMLYIVFNPKAETAKLTFTAVLNGGFIYGVATASSNPASHGTITGGTGAFTGAKGTLLAKNVNKAGTRTAVTITYHK